MTVLLAKSAGFCYGVRRAVELAERTGEETGGCWMLGDLIHNSHVVEDLARRGVDNLLHDGFSHFVNWIIEEPPHRKHRYFPGGQHCMLRWSLPGCS